MRFFVRVTYEKKLHRCFNFDIMFTVKGEKKEENDGYDG